MYLNSIQSFRNLLLCIFFKPSLNRTVCMLLVNIHTFGKLFCKKFFHVQTDVNYTMDHSYEIVRVLDICFNSFRRFDKIMEAASIFMGLVGWSSYLVLIFNENIDLQGYYTNTKWLVQWFYLGVRTHPLVFGFGKRDYTSWFTRMMVYEVLEVLRKCRYDINQVFKYLP